MKVSLDLDNEHLAEEYERVSLERQFRAGQRLVQELEIRAGETVLDIGAGTGLLAEYAAELVGPNGVVIGIDPLPLRIEIAKRRTRPNLSFEVGNAYDLSRFAENRFDAVYMNAVFHWLPEKREPLRQIIRVLKKGGRLGISTGAKGNRNALHAVRERVLSSAPYNEYAAASDPVIRRVSADELANLLRETGFEIKKVEAQPNMRRRVSPEEAIVFSEASSFGNFLGHLPEDLRSRAREEIKRELEKVGMAAGTPRQRFHLMAVASKR
jgi:arsenite methyltransferase